jgi:predicted site-specific integrase-resolvase
MQRLKDYAAARGYTVATEVTEIASDLNDMHRNFSNCLQILTIPPSPRHEMAFHDNSEKSKNEALKHSIVAPKQYAVQRSVFPFSPFEGRAEGRRRIAPSQCR